MYECEKVKYAYCLCTTCLVWRLYTFIYSMALVGTLWPKVHIIYIIILRLELYIKL